MLKYFSLPLVAWILYGYQPPVYAEGVSINLSPNGTKVIENTYLWSLNATCKIECNDAVNTLKVSVLKNTGVINGKNLKVGQSTSLTIHNHDSISVSAEPGAKVNIENKGSTAIHASCSA